ncbi:phospholipid/glycerol acyltransferase [Rippkaea orientalis PCC 8801]|uniref:Phospholipid/glycerol acyltransferase n=1 Tax=Rippkaea orientalis (strain PCC 8801 / RF-1) TaxID=41431 RepID=B7JX55_RIPO1|nr:1-acyl-sn-glycerol-3-phosphate acyltransferase [Rippkaea orientalis]ACK67043.1 phospholipid/glycerol acyltransferase [Rippkaea orientalis PCC 8801]
MPKVHSRLEFIPQRFNDGVVKLVHLLLPLVLRFRTRPWLMGGIVRIDAVHTERLVDLYQQFQGGKIRFLMGFRHAEVEDPLCLLYLMSRLLPQAAIQAGIKLQLPIHNHFIYDRGMTIWAGKWLGWLFSRGGGIPIHRGKPLDRAALREARGLLINGRFPFTIAPEGATNGHGETLSPLEPGLAQLGFWGVEDLNKANRQELVYILPMGIRYYFVTPSWQKIEGLLGQLESQSGLEVKQLSQEHWKNPANYLYPRLLSLGEHLLTKIEEFYRRFYHQSLPKLNEDSSSNYNQFLALRLQRLLDVALKVAENYFGLSSQGSIIDRCRRLEEAGWNYIYREDIKDLKTLSALDLGLANWVAEEADLRLKHMRMVESFVAVSANYIQEKPTAERFAETLWILFDTIERIKGKKMPRRPYLGKRWVKITIGEPICVTERWENYHNSRQQAKQAVNQLTEDLQIALEKLIVDE